MNAVTKAISIVGLSHLAKRLDVTYQALRKWETTRVPAERCYPLVQAVEQEEQGAITVHDLRPDIFGPAPGVPPVIPGAPVQPEERAA
jgi:DNA-binding transcriptional regulator YdaS (Cro superfamily)